MSEPRPPRIGLVLGAGGITGFAYHSGVLSAIGQLTGWDARTADIIIGTSAGSGFGAMLRGDVPVDEVLAHLLGAPSNPETMARLRVLSGRELNSPSWLWFGPSSPRLLARELTKAPWRIRPSRLGVALLPNGRIPTEFVGDRARELHGLDWPEETYWACAVRLRDGERTVFGRAGSETGQWTDVDVGTAVEASSAIPGFFRPVWIHNERYVDGAIHSPTNADLIIDCLSRSGDGAGGDGGADSTGEAGSGGGRDLDLVVILSPMSGSCSSAVRSLDVPLRLTSAAALNREVKELRRYGLPVLVLEPGPEEIRTMGPISMDPTRMVPTVLQANSSTLQRLAKPEYAERLAVLQRAAEQSTPRPDVPYPTDVTGRIE